MKSFVPLLLIQSILPISVRPPNMPCNSGKKFSGADRTITWTRNSLGRLRCSGLRRCCTPGLGDVETNRVAKSRIWKRRFPPHLYNPAHGARSRTPRADSGWVDSPRAQCSLPMPSLPGQTLLRFDPWKIKGPGGCLTRDPCGASAGGISGHQLQHPFRLHQPPGAANIPQQVVRRQTTPDARKL
jgi:hypothetical protein